ncbi:gliding motility-associated C-terminal domain-containing protein, partial [uncultured Tenacibaculum sp.]|uniref:HYR-like domain-containing protein n=1 Tax=uncultured Tenacibaculum sp. TaxID=174713 RepID=UPI00262E94F5
VQTITVEDNTAPDFTVPANTTIYAAVDCTYDASVGVTGDVTDESDNCDTSLEATFSDSVAAGSCEGEQVITRTWSLTDDCGNTTSKVQTITVEDNTAPDFTVPANTTIYAAVDCTYDASVGVTGDVTDESDNCDTSLEATFSDSVAAGSCEGEQVITRTWSLTDDCGNTTSKVQTITVEDNTAPDFTVPANTTIYAAADCTYDASVGVTGDVTDESDNCDTSLEATFSDSVAAGSCEGEQVITRTWSLTDDCGNTTSKVQTITVEDNTAPDFTVPANTTIYAAADCTYDASVGVTGDVTDESDNCDTSLEATFSDSVAAGSCEGEQVITRTWSLTDDCGNTTSKVQTITVEDNTAPDFTVPANTTIYAAADCTYDASVGVTGDVTDESDNCDASLEATFSDSVAAGSCEGEQVITRTWSLTDDCGNTTSKVQTITVEDNTAPDFTVPANTTIYAAADCTYDASVGVTGDVTDESDNCDTSLEATFSDSVAAGSCEGEQVITRTWSLTDDCGNTTSKVQTITVEDNTAPDFTVPANTTIYAAADCTYDASVGVTGDVTDESDNCDTSLEATFSDSVASGSCEGEQVITRTWSLTDDCGNTTSKVQTITVEDNTAPIIDETNKANIDIECGVGNTTQKLQDWLDNNAGATATDNCSSVVWTNDYGNDTSIKCDGSYINVTFTATDACGNQSSVVAGYLIKDDTAPVIATEASSSTVECDGSGNLSELNTWLSSNGGASATDACSVVSWSNNFTELDYTCSFVGEVEVIFTATDACGNTSTSTAKFTIEDTKAPKFVESLPDDITVSCDNIPAMEVLTATDDCDTTVTVVPSEVTSGDDDACGSEYLITRKWTVSDCSGNTTTHIQSITVEDTKAPEFVESLPDDITVSCDNIPAMEVLTATDNCDTTVTVVPSEVTSGDDDACGSEYLITRKWTVSDCSGNTTT